MCFTRVRIAASLRSRRWVRTAFVIALSLSACTSAKNSGVSELSKKAPGAQDPSLPHPGAIAARFTWNNSVEYWDASKYPDVFIFHCYGKDGRATSRSKAAWCIPVVEVETVSFDKNYKPASPKEAAFIENTVFGPNHTFLEHTTSGPIPLQNSGNGDRK